MHRVFFGHHKCASRFFRLRLFAPIAKQNRWGVLTYKIQDPPFHFGSLPDLDLYNLDFARIRDGEPLVINLTNSTASTLTMISKANPNFRGLRVIRDPRQVLISAYFHHRDNHPTESQQGWVWDKLAIDQPRLRALSIEDGILYELDNISREILEQQLFAWSDDPRVLNERLENINQDRPEFLRKLQQHLNIPKMPEVDWSRTFSDSGAGDWQTYFTPRIRRAFDDRYGDQVEKLGYPRSG
jgi:hypothetical protein